MKVHLTPVDIIRKKRDGKKLSKAEIEYFISEYTKGNIADYQMAAFLMAVYFQNMDFEETAHLMQAMMESGATMHLPDIRPPKVDKHSTGGVGDKVSLILAPLVAACGICVPMISGRGLGHTGGTLDKLESIPGFNTDLKIKRFKRQLQKIGVAMIGQTAEVAPADKKMYALRDVTATVDSIPLIAASIMSKKLAEDLDGLVLDVKFGNGAFMQDYKQARMLAVAMVEIGRRTGVKTVAVMTNMNDPLGVNVGNSLEVIEAIEALKGRGPRDLMDVTFALGAEMLNVVKIKGGRKLLEEKIANGAALEKFREIIEYQGGDTRVVDDHSYLPVSKKKVRVLSHDSGYVHEIDCFAIGMLLVKLGGGRTKKEDSIDASCGFKIYKKTGDYVKKEMCLAEAFGDNRAKLQRVALKLKQAFSIRKRPPKQKKLIREIVKY